MDGACGLVFFFFFSNSKKMCLVEMKLKIGNAGGKIADSKDLASAPSIILTVPTEDVCKECVYRDAPGSSEPGPPRDRIASMPGVHVSLRFGPWMSLNLLSLPSLVVHPDHELKPLSS